MGDRTPVNELTVGSIHQTMLLSQATIAQTKNGDPYLRGTLGDETGTLPCISWDITEARELGAYEVSGMVETYNGRLQVKVYDLTPVEGGGELVRRCPQTEEDLRNALAWEVENLSSEYAEIVDSIFSDSSILTAFLRMPAAASNHHAYRGGLAEHTLMMCTQARDIAGNYISSYGEDAIDAHLLIAGCLLHDLGKVYEYEESLGTAEKTRRGYLVGHMAEVVALIHDAAAATLASQETRDKLIHMVLAHHGKPEWGSPVSPCLLEAQLLHLIDMMDSRFSMFREAVDGLSDGEMSEKVWALGGRVTR
jgi:3'-5' exoribonuclease